MRIEDEVKLDFKDVLLRPKRSSLNSRSQVNLIRDFTFRNSGHKWSGIPIMAANMDTIGTFEMFYELKKESLFTCLHKHYDILQLNEFCRSLGDSDFDYFALSTGTSENDFNKIKTVIRQNPKVSFVCVDVANGYSVHFSDFVKKIRDEFPKITIIAGNVVTAEMTEQLILDGADIVKIGIGPGSVCTTRIQTGVGYPQLSAIIECADAAHGLKGHIIGDGGCVCPGDVAKAFGGGADFVMLGGMLSGHDECTGAIIEKDGKKYKEYYGMSSQKAMERYNGGLAHYRSSEGREVKVPYRGPVENTIRDILGGVRSTCTYVGAARLKGLSRRTTFLKVHSQFNSSLID